MFHLAKLATSSQPLKERRVAGLIWVLAASAVAALFIIILTSWNFTTLALRSEFSAQIRQATGLSMISEGRAVFALLPQPHIKIEQVAFADRSGAVQVEANFFKGRLRFFPLFAGRLEIASATLFKPHLSIDLDRKLDPTESAIGRSAEAPSATVEAAVADEARLGTLTLLDGTASIIAEAKSQPIVIDNINMTLDWPNLHAPASLSGQARIQDIYGDVALWLATPTELLRGKESEMTLGIKSELLALRAKGTLSRDPKLRFAGNLNATSGTLPKLLDLFGFATAQTLNVKAIAIAGDVMADFKSFSTSNLSLQLGQSSFEGSLAVQTQAERPVISATLATDLLDLNALANPLQVGATGGMQSPIDPASLHNLSAADLDLRISAQQTRLSNFAAADMALSLMTHADRFDLGLAEAKAYHGLLKAKATLNVENGSVDLHASGSASDIDLGMFTSQFTALPQVTGQSQANADIETHGHSPAEFLANIKGHAQIAASNGELSSMQDAPTAQAKAPVAFTAAQFGVTIFDGAAEVEHGLADGPNGHMLFNGLANLSKQELDLRALLLPIPSDNPAASQSHEHIISVKGAWAHPSITRDAP